MYIHFAGMPYYTNSRSYTKLDWSHLPYLLYFLEGYKYIELEVDESGKKKLVQYSSLPFEGCVEISLFDYFPTYKDVWGYISDHPASQEAKYLRKQVQSMYN